MRHQTKRHRLGRTASHRSATLANLSAALIAHKRIRTTLQKAKALRVFVEPIIHRAKEDTTSNRRQAFRHLQNKESIKELFGDIAARLGDRPGGYTRIIRVGLRPGDGAEMAMIELVDYNDVRPGGAEGGASSRRRRTRRSAGRKDPAAQAPAAKAPKAAPAPQPAAAPEPAAATPEEVVSAEDIAAADVVTAAEAPVGAETAPPEPSEDAPAAADDDAEKPA